MTGFETFPIFDGELEIRARGGASQHARPVLVFARPWPAHGDRQRPRPGAERGVSGRTPSGGRCASS